MINQSNASGLKHVSKAILTAVIAFVVAIGVFATSAFAGLVSQYNVEIQIDSDSVVIATNETQPIEILAQANIALAESDKLDITGFTEGEGGVIRIDKLNNVNIEFDGTISTYSVYADTVGDAFDELGLNVEDEAKVNYALTDTVKDGMVITIRSAKHVTVSVDGKSSRYAIHQGTVNDLLSLAQVTLGKDDYTQPSADTELKENMTVTVFRVEYKTVTAKEEVAFKTIRRDDPSKPQGSETVMTEGVNGEDEVSYKVKYVNGKESEKTEISRTTVKQPIHKVLKVGTKQTDVKANGVSSRNGFSVGQKVTGRYTHYCACSSCNGKSDGITASGKRVYNGMSNPYYVACNWLPLGTVINVDGQNYTVVDRGGSGLSTTGRIDIFTPEGHAACYQYGTGSCSIEIIRLGW